MAVTLLCMSPVRLRGMCCHDDPGTARAVRLILDRCGFDPAADTRTVGEAVAVAAVVRPDVVVVDLDLTGTLGLGVVAALHDASPGSKVVVLSSFDTMRPAVLAAGAHDFVVSVDLRDLESALSALARVRAYEHGARSAVGTADIDVVAVEEDAQEVRAATSSVTPAATSSVTRTCRTKTPSS